MTSGDTTPAGRSVVKPTPLGLMILSLLFERQMHPYEMQLVMAGRGKDQVVNVQRGSLYPAVERLAKAGLVEPAQTVRDGRRPERTTYRLTEDGAETCALWLAGMLRMPRNEYPEFPAALAFLPVLGPEEVVAQLHNRLVALHREQVSLQSAMAILSEQYALPRVFEIEDEYRLHMVQAELAWVQGLVADLTSGALDWNREKIEHWARDVEVRMGSKPSA